MTAANILSFLIGILTGMGISLLVVAYYQRPRQLSQKRYDRIVEKYPLTQELYDKGQARAGQDRHLRCL